MNFIALIWLRCLEPNPLQYLAVMREFRLPA